jgi:hypothetical protein
MNVAMRGQKNVVSTGPDEKLSKRTLRKDEEEKKKQEAHKKQLVETLRQNASKGKGKAK